MFNPHYAYSSVAAGAPATKTQTEWYHFLKDFSPYKALAADSIFDVADINHLRKQAGVYVSTYNMVFKDGHVASVNDKYVYASLAGRGGTGGIPVRLEDNLDVLEAEADGRNPAQSAGDPTHPLATPNSLVYRIVNIGGAPDYHPFVPWQN